MKDSSFFLILVFLGLCTGCAVQSVERVSFSQREQISFSVGSTSTVFVSKRLLSSLLYQVFFDAGYTIQEKKRDGWHVFVEFIQKSPKKALYNLYNRIIGEVETLEYKVILYYHSKVVQEGEYTYCMYHHDCKSFRGFQQQKGIVLEEALREIALHIESLVFLCMRK